MPKTEVYSWRITPELKAELETAARLEKTNVGALLSRIAEGWLEKRRADHEKEQGRLHARLAAAVEAVSDDPKYSSDTYSKDKLRRRVVERVGRRMSDEGSD